MVAARQVCTGCGLKRLLTSFPPDLRRLDKISTRCNICHKRKSRAVTRTVRIKETYGITEAEYAAILAHQGGVCAICKGVRNYSYDVDHSHAMVRAGSTVRESVRGCLCKSCNRRLLKAAKDDVAILHNAVDYLLSPPARYVLDPE